MGKCVFLLNASSVAVALGIYRNVALMLLLDPQARLETRMSRFRYHLFFAKMMY